jgi:hypothetical protein
MWNEGALDFSPFGALFILIGREDVGVDGILV